ncbi:MAG: hypothetical protein CMI58_06320 [Parcubacteria group bacterium]|nr:hypothetical protein [Parcubacteria group bacterium]
MNGFDANLVMAHESSIPLHPELVQIGFWLQILPQLILRLAKILELIGSGSRLKTALCARVIKYFLFREILTEN